MKYILILLTSLTCVAQVPPMPLAITNIIAPIHTKKLITYTANCPHCGIKYSNLHPINVVTNGSVATNGGYIIQRTLTFGCPNFECRENFDSRNTTFIQESIAVEDAQPKGSAGGASILPDTNAPVVTNFILRSASILDFTNEVSFTFRINNGHFYWLDALTGQQVTKALDFEFQTHSNSFYTVWLCSPLSSHSTNWVEYPTDKQLHPARSDFMAGVSVPLYDTNRFYAIRAFNGGNRVTWQ